MAEKPMIPQDRVAGALQNTPENTNPSFASNFRLMIPKVRSGVYFCTEVSFPDMTCEPIRVPMRMAPALKFFGHKITHGDMTVKFIVNEDYSNYQQMVDWYKSTLVFEDFFKTGIDTSINLLSNVGHLLILSNKKNPVARFRFNGLMITGITSIEYNSALTDATATTATATFAFSSYDLDSL
jgi:hypothetical protein